MGRGGFERRDTKQINLNPAESIIWTDRFVTDGKTVKTLEYARKRNMILSQGGLYPKKGQTFAKNVSLVKILKASNAKLNTDDFNLNRVKGKGGFYHIACIRNCCCQCKFYVRSFGGSLK